MTRDDVIAFRFTSRFDDKPFVRTHGFHINQVGWQSTVQIIPPEESADRLTMQVRSTGESVWMQMAGWPVDMAGCWLLMPPRNFPIGVMALTPHQPTYIRLLADLHTRGFAGKSTRTLVGETGLAPAVRLLQGQAYEKINVTPRQLRRNRVPVQIDLDGGRVTSVRVTGMDLADAVENAGGRVRFQAHAYLELATLRVTYPPPQGAKTVTAPSQDLVVTEDDADQSCH